MELEKVDISMNVFLFTTRWYPIYLCHNSLQIQGKYCDLFKILTISQKFY